MARNNLGTVKQGRDELFYGRVRWTDEATGKPREKKFPGQKTDSDAWKLVHGFKQDLDRPGTKSADAEKITFAEQADRFERTYLIEAEIRDGVKVKGLKSLRNTKAQMKMLRAFFGRKKLREIRYSDLERLHAERLHTPVTHARKAAGAGEQVSKPRAVATVNRELALLRRMLNTALQDGVIAENPFRRGKGLVSAALEVARDRVLSHDEESAMLTACEMDDKQGRPGRYSHLRPILICAVETAMRAGEMFKLERRDVDLTSGVIRVRVENSKTMKTRLVPVTTRLRHELETVLGGLPDEPSVRVFGVECVKHSFATVCDAARVSGVRFHDLRHTAITRMVAAGIPAPEVMKISGHTQMSTFMRYLNQTPESLNRAAELLSAHNLRSGMIVATEAVH